MQKFSKSISTNFGFRLTLFIGNTVVAHVTAGVITSLCFFNFRENSGLVSADNATKLAEEPEFTIDAKFDFRYFEKSFSNFLTLTPIVTFVVSSESSDSNISSGPKDGLINEITLFPGINSFFFSNFFSINFLIMGSTEVIISLTMT